MRMPSRISRSVMAAATLADIWLRNGRSTLVTSSGLAVFASGVVNHLTQGLIFPPATFAAWSVAGFASATKAAQGVQAVILPDRWVRLFFTQSRIFSAC